MNEGDITQHYTTAGIADRILASLRAAKGADVAITPDALAPLDHFHGRGIVATKELVALLDPRAGERILDIGSGIGGPARWIAHHFGCHVTGVDLTAAFCAAARALNDATGMADRVMILEGDATDLPVAASAFDRAYSQNVVMNIADKPAFYRSARRALKAGGVLALSNICAGPSGPPRYPTPWAASAATSFLATPDETRRDIAAAGFDIVSFRDTTAEVVPQQAKVRESLERDGLPAIGMHVLMGERMRELQLNSIRSMEEGRIVPVEILARKPT
jgi:cyclopropane fatty-acyl-phospholipid synthase-like methyltransferase